MQNPQWTQAAQDLVRNSRATRGVLQFLGRETFVCMAVLFSLIAPGRSAMRPGLETPRAGRSGRGGPPRVLHRAGSGGKCRTGRGCPAPRAEVWRDRECPRVLARTSVPGEVAAQTRPPASQKAGAPRRVRRRPAARPDGFTDYPPEIVRLSPCAIATSRTAPSPSSRCRGRARRGPRRRERE